MRIVSGFGSGYCDRRHDPGISSGVAVEVGVVVAAVVVAVGVGVAVEVVVVVAVWVVVVVGVVVGFAVAIEFPDGLTMTAAMIRASQVTFTIPIRTRSALNQRIHWAVRARQVRLERDATCFYGYRPMKRAKLLGIGDAGGSIVVTLTRIAPRKLDDDNLRGALKAVRDQIAEMLGVDDRDPVVTWRYGQGKGKPKEYAVVVSINRSTATNHGDTLVKE